MIENVLATECPDMTKRLIDARAGKDPTMIGAKSMRVPIDRLRHSYYIVLRDDLNNLRCLLEKKLHFLPTSSIGIKFAYR